LPRHQPIALAAGRADAPIYDRARLGAGDRIAGPAILTHNRRYQPAAAGPDRRGPPFRQLGRPRSVAPWSPRARRTENRLDKGRLPRPRVTVGATAKTGRKPRTTSGRGRSGHWPRAAAGSWSTCWCGAAVRPADRARYASARLS